MKTVKIIRLIEETVTQILQQEYLNSESFLTIEDVVIKYLEEESYYNVLLRCNISNVETTFEVGALAGLPSNIFDFNQKEAYAFAIYVANIAIKLHDYREIIQDQDEPEDSQADPKYIC